MTSSRMTMLERWSVVAGMVGAVGLGVLVSAGVGCLMGARSYGEAVGLGMTVLAVHLGVSVVAGVVSAGGCGMGTSVGAHLGVYHLLSPWAVVARVRWLRCHRRGFVRGWFLRGFFGVYSVLAGAVVGVWWFWS